MPLARGPSPASTVEDESEQQSGMPLASKLIAVIDDDKSVSGALARLIRSWGASAVCASDGDELLHAFEDVSQTS